MGKQIPLSTSFQLPDGREVVLETGKIQPFGRATLQAWIEDDAQLWRTVSELTEAEAAEKLFKCLLIYDDRNQVLVPQRD